MIDEWIKSANGFLLLFAINDKESFEAMKEKVKRIKKNNKGDLPIVLVGNKCDLESKREVDKQIAIDYAKTIGANYYETSALTDENKNCKASSVLQKISSLFFGSILWAYAFVFSVRSENRMIS